MFWFPNCLSNSSRICSYTDKRPFALLVVESTGRPFALSVVDSTGRTVQRADRPRTPPTSVMECTRSERPESNSQIAPAVGQYPLTNSVAHAASSSTMRKRLPGLSSIPAKSIGRARVCVADFVGFLSRQARDGRISSAVTASRPAIPPFTWNSAPHDVMITSASRGTPPKSRKNALWRLVTTMPNDFTFIFALTMDVRTPRAKRILTAGGVG